MRFGPEFQAKLDDLQASFPELNFRCDGVPEGVVAFGDHMLRQGRGPIPIAVSMIGAAAAMLQADCAQYGDGMAQELFDIIVNRVRQEMQNG